MFALGPFLLIFAYWENKFIISQYVVFWDNMVVSYMGLFLYALAGIIAIVSRFQLGRQGGGFLVIEDDHLLVETGLYRYIRHPLYLASLLGLLGFGLVFRSIIMTVFVLIVYFLVFKHRLEYEERILEEEFGEKYTEYKKRTKRLIPFIY